MVAKAQEQLRREAEREREERRRKIQSDRLHQVENVDIDPRSNRMRAFSSDSEHWEEPWHPIDSSGGDDQAYWSNSAQTSSGANAQLSQRKQTGGSSGAVPKPKRTEANAEAHSKAFVWKQRIYANEQGNWQARK
jgi:hypothetical protein